MSLSFELPAATLTRNRTYPDARTRTHTHTSHTIDTLLRARLHNRTRGSMIEPSLERDVCALNPYRLKPSPILQPKGSCLQLRSGRDIAKGGSVLCALAALLGLWFGKRRSLEKITTNPGLRCLLGKHASQLHASKPDHETMKPSDRCSDCW